MAQAFVKPCSWSHSYLVIPGVDEPFSKHFNFDPVRLHDYSSGCSAAPVQKIDAEFMLQVACDQARRFLTLTLGVASAQISSPTLLSKTEISLLYLSGDFPQLSRLVSICGEHYLLYRELLELQSLPALTISDGFPAGLDAG